MIKNKVFLIIFLLISSSNSLSVESPVQNDTKKDLKVAQENAAFKKFAVEFPLQKLDIKSIPNCKKLFRNACGSEDYPSLLKFNGCLLNKFDEFKAVKSCQDLAHAFLYMGFLSRIPRLLNMCKPIYEKCDNLAKKDKRIGPIGCVVRDPDAPAVCFKLASDSYKYRLRLAQVYDLKIAPDITK